jgi:uncharacterized protein (TIGR02300 family)
VAKPELGLKRNCPNCSAVFYDLNNDPIICPACEASFEPQQMTRLKRSRPVPQETKPAKPAKDTDSDSDDDLDDIDDVDDDDDDDDDVLEDASDLGDDTDGLDVVVDKDDDQKDDS